MGLKTNQPGYFKVHPQSPPKQKPKAPLPPVRLPKIVKTVLPKGTS